MNNDLFLRCLVCFLGVTVCLLCVGRLARAWRACGAWGTCRASHAAAPARRWRISRA